MKLCFNEATTKPNSNLEKDLLLCDRYGFDYIEMRIEKIKEYLATHSLDDLKFFFETHHIKPFCFNVLIGILFCDDEKWAKMLEDMDFFCTVGDAIDCRLIVATPSPDIDYCTVSEIKAEAVKRLHALDAIGSKHQMKIAFEHVGVPHFNVNTFYQAYDIVAACNSDSVGCVFDCAHFQHMDRRYDLLEKADASKIFILHLDDTIDLHIGQGRDYHRVWPGDGVVDYDRIFNILRGKGWDGVVSLELFNPKYWELDPEEAIRTGREKSVKVLSKYFPDMK
ncbi:MAG: sugar phosphate isomerase/epimerase family protein [Christensenellales bacterium]